MGISYSKILCFLWTAIFLSGTLFAAEARPPLKVAAVQMYISEDTYASEEAFWRAVEAPLARAAGEGADLVVFPEYLGVFYSLIPYRPLFQGASHVEEALFLLSRLRGAPMSPGELFLSQGERIDLALKEWIRLSREYGVALVAGSFFVPQENPQGTAELRNRTYVVSPHGGVIYSQDKVFLTDFERDLVGLSPGEVDSGGFVLQGHRIVITLCRDTFFPVWEQAFRGQADLWIDIKANGAVFDLQQEEIFSRALPSRLPGTQIPYGLTVCLTGRYLDLFWEGRSSFIQSEEDGVITLVESVYHDTEDILFFTIP